MITILNRREIAVTFSISEKERITGLLSANEIPYMIRVSGRSGGFGGSRSRFGTMGQNMNLDYEYRIYVKKEDYQRAQFCVRG